MAASLAAGINMGGGEAGRNEVELLHIGGGPLFSGRV